MTSSAIVQKLWNYCNVLRDDGMSYAKRFPENPAVDSKKLRMQIVS